MKNIFIPLLWVLISCTGQTPDSENKVRVGAEILIANHLSELEGKRVGLVMNPTARINGVHVLDTLYNSGVNITALFAPEHGFRGDFADGEKIESGLDEETGIPVFSLYGSSKKPTGEMMDEVDILIFDMQDVGARFYTYNSTMKSILEAGAEFGKEVWILDRPNPAGGDYVSGWILEDEFRSFIGSYPIPVIHGLTLGELALMAAGEGWLETDAKPDLKVIPMQGWKREMKWPETGLNWIPPSPNLPTFEHAYVYLGTCIFEGVSISEGRGTEDPFLTIGTPEVKLIPDDLKVLSEKYELQLDTLTFLPETIPGKAVNPKFEDELVPGVFIQTTSGFDKPFEFGLDLLHAFNQKITESSDTLEYRKHLLLLSGTRELLPFRSAEEYNWGESFDEYLKKREGYLLYD